MTDLFNRPMLDVPSQSLPVVVYGLSNSLTLPSVRDLQALKEDVVASVLEAGILNRSTLEDMFPSLKVNRKSDPFAVFTEGVAYVPMDGPITWPSDNVLPGLSVLFGLTRSGKTTMGKNKYKPEILIQVDEPFEVHPGFPGTVVRATTFTDAICFALALSAVYDTKIVIDSGRSLVFRGKGDTMSGGLKSSVFDDLTILNNVFAAYSCHVMLTLNPMIVNVDPKLVVSIEASVAGISHVVWDEGQGKSVIARETYRKADGSRNDVIGSDHRSVVYDVEPAAHPFASSTDVFWSPDMTSDRASDVSILDSLPNSQRGGTDATKPAARTSISFDL